MSSANLTREETAARAAGIHLQTVEVDLDLRSAPDAATRTFPTRSTLVFTSDHDETWVDFIGESVEEVTVNGHAHPVQWDGARVHLAGLNTAPDATNLVMISASGRYSTSGEGLHRFRDPVDDETYLYTQYEPADCRRVYPCFEQPDMKARWSFTVTAPARWQVLSNGAEVQREDVHGGVRVAFSETLPLSSYITAVAAGPYHRVDGVYEREDGMVPLGVLCRASLAEHLDAEEILGITARGLAFFEDSFDFAYPWGTYDQIFVPEYNLGAMENPGLVTFTEAYIFRGASTGAQHEARANTILHEMAHMWFGDLVTMRWWDDLWLKESFADYMGTHAAAAVGGYPDAWVSFATRRKGWAYTQDQLPTTHPIVADIPDIEAAKLNFDGITYAKGASVLKQLVGFVGEEVFFRGAQRYFADHAYGNTTLPDLLDALEIASGRDLRAWSTAWLQTTGVAELSAHRASGADGIDLVVSDVRPDRVTVGLYVDATGTLVRSGEVASDITGPCTTIANVPLDDVALVLPNDDDRTYAKVRLDQQSTDAVARALSTIGDALARAVIWAALWNAVRDGILPTARYVAIVSQHAPAESDPALLTDATARAAFSIAHFAADSDRDTLAAQWLETAWNALQTADGGSDAQLVWARSVGAAAAVCDDRATELKALLAGEASAPVGLPLDPDLRWSWLLALSATGHADLADIERELASDPTSTGQVAARAARAARPDAAVRADAWAAAWTDESLTNEHVDATIAGVRAGGRRDLIESFDDDYFARIRPAWSAHSIEIARRLVIGLFPASPTLAPVDDWLTANADAPGALRRLVIEQRDGLARDLRVRAAQTSN
ncbi:aminopeptidase N [Microbacterium sp. VKM Ac-2870]|uniref:aminopeptidase N n=1 Tax=Microbacterium sp. VKM Ac-2870 TaxID=2783825 RepID=UPI00188A2829|nr:aminopeptidase N [Microbacterium sp. VKM Ac-2870]MBF4560891.1 aminopeptidase N [Microbacterium sp. VKM Ac-2870]